jgi:hypothetical protein
MNEVLHISSVRNKGVVTPPTALNVFVTKYKARKAAKRITKSLKEVRDFESGKKTPKSFDDFLNEL